MKILIAIFAANFATNHVCLPHMSRHFPCPYRPCNGHILVKLNPKKGGHLGHFAAHLH